MELLCSSTKPTKNARLRFTMQNDLDILRQVLVENPFEDPSRWQSINNSINAITGKDFSVRATREHTEYLLKLFAKEDLSKLRKSGTEESYLEKERLLQEITDLKRDFCNKSILKPKLNITSKSKKEGSKTREAALVNCSNKSSLIAVTNITPSNIETQVDDNQDCQIVDIENLHSNPDSPLNPEESSSSSSTLLVPYKSRKRNYNDQQVKSDILKYLRERSDKENRLKEQQIEIENKRIQLKEQKLLLEEQKYQIEKEERLSLIENMKNQQQLLANVIAQLTTNKN
ncbi:hypothetical protein ABEB36_015514 [Hypothenemus hampei]|uniref:Uncharacterized protein n=1 Tax=Hypothenemus hampei TaxID=57062 RepID=A0ABD1E2C4_HYPHA